MTIISIFHFPHFIQSFLPRVMQIIAEELVKPLLAITVPISPLMSTFLCPYIIPHFYWTHSATDVCNKLIISQRDLIGVCMYIKGLLLVFLDPSFRYALGGSGIDKCQVIYLQLRAKLDR